MKLRPSMKKYIIAGAICFLVIAATMAGLILASRNNCQDVAVETSGGYGSAGVITGGGHGLAGEEQEQTGMKDGEQTPDGQADGERPGGISLNIYSTDRDINLIIDLYAQKHWDFDYNLNVYNDIYLFGATEIADLAGEALTGSNGSEVDIYCLPAAYAPKFIKGEYSSFACTYKELGIDVDTALMKAEIPECIVEDGSNPDGELIALPYLAETSLFMYRRSVAKGVWGTDDPDRIAAIIGAGTQKWDKFIEAAQALREYGYYIVPGFRDMERMVDTTAAYLPGPVEGFEADPEWVEFMDVSKYLLDNDFIKHTRAWWDGEWFKDLNGQNDRVFGFVTSTDMFQFIGIDETAGDWAACIPPFNTRTPYNTGILVSKNSPNKDLLGPLIEWITLDSSVDGFQYSLANAASSISSISYDNEKLSVSSGAVMKKVDGSRSILGGQNINPLVYDALKGSKGLYRTNNYEYDYFSGWLDVMQAVIDGEKDRDTGIADFLSQVRETGKVLPPRDPSLEELVVWKDENFKAAVREQLQVPILTDIDKGYLRNVTELDLSGRDIKSLEDIVHFKDLVRLDCSNNQITDISCLKELKKLRKLELSINMISDISGLGDLTYLRELYLNNNKISDISSLKGLSRLETLYLSGNRISDIRSLAGLQKLEDLDLAFNRISDISSLKKLTKLRSLNLTGNDVTDRSPADHVDNVQWK